MGCLVAPALAVVMVVAGLALTGVTALFMGVATVLVTGMTGFIALLMILI
ncbi:MAG: hypothetical protein ACNA7X_04730 [Dehalococcoidia bacterium]